jgi:hypothetical protein
MKTKPIYRARYFKLLILIFLLQFSSTNYLVAQKVKFSKEPIVVKPVPQDKIEEYRNDNDFKYIKKQQPGDSLWDVFWYYVFKFLGYIFSDEGATPYIRNSIIAAILIFVAIRLFRADFSGIIGKDININRSNFDYLDEDIRGLNFDEEINKAIEKQNYRLAIRFLYLKLLHLLNQKGFINWLPEKTNRRYLQELSDETISRYFKNLSYIYEYSWYGHFEPQKQQFEDFFKEFEHGFSLIDKK